MSDTALLDDHQAGQPGYADHCRSEAMFGTCRDCTLARVAIATEHHTPTPASGGKLRRHPTPAERQAARTVKAGTQQAELVRQLHLAADGLTAREAADLLGISPNQAAARLLELRERGLATWRPGNLLDRSDSDGWVVRETTPGNYGRVHYPTDAQA